MTTHNALRYQQGCRCDICRESERQRKARYRKAKAIDPRPCYVDATGIRRRIQGLACLGYTWADLSAETGIPWKNFATGGIGRNSTSRNYHARIAKAYDRLWNVQPAMTRGRKKAQTEARLKGWAPPMAWCDDLIDDPLATPHVEAAVDVDWQAVERAIQRGYQAQKLTRLERVAAARAMASRGATGSAISKTLGFGGSEARKYVEEAA